METLVDREGLISSPPQLGCALYVPGLPGGGSKIYNRSPYGNIGTIVGATWKRLPSGLWCLDFDGVDDRVNCGSGASLNITGTITLEAWIRPDSLQAGDHYHIISKRNGWGAGLIPYDLYWNNGIAYLRIWETTNYVASKSGLSVGTFSHVVGVYDGTQLIVYVDTSAGTPVASTEGMPDSSSISLWIGDAPGNTPVVFDGIIALARVYNHALSALEIQNHFNQEKHLFGVW